LEAVETVVAVPADLRLAMTGWPRDSERRLRLWPVRGPGRHLERSARRVAADLARPTSASSAAILLLDWVRPQGEWPDRLSYDSTEQHTEPARLPATPPVQRRGPIRSGFGLGTLAERGGRARS
jgi:hypothetical protein